MTAADAIARPRPLAEALRSYTWTVRWWLIGRGLVVAVALATHAVGPAGYLQPNERAATLGVLESWDAHWYRTVAAHGYLLVPGRQSDPAFFPLLPLLLHGSHLLDVGYGTSGIVIANIAFLVALVAFHALTRDLLGDPLARRATVYLAIFPFGYVFSMAYPESLELAAITLAALAAVRNRWLLAGVFASAAALARPEGALVVVPLLGLAWHRSLRLSSAGRGAGFGAALAPVGALASYSLYLHQVTRDPLAWSHAEHAWGRRFSPLGLVHSITRVGTAFAGNAWVARDVAAAVLYLVLLAAAARSGAPKSWLAAGAATVLLPLFSGSFTSLGRLGVVAVPIYWGLAALGADRRGDLAIRAVSLALLAAATATIPLVFP